nr:DUF805 domain-containing protein [Listeria booriae]
MGFSEAYKSFWRNYVNFKDRAPRSAYWYVVLWNAIIVALFHIFILILVFTTGPFTGKDLELFFYFTVFPILFVLLVMGYTA